MKSVHDETLRQVKSDISVGEMVRIPNSIGTVVAIDVQHDTMDVIMQDDGSLVQGIPWRQVRRIRRGKHQ